MHLTHSTLTVVLFSALFIFSHITEAHSWADCINWIPKDPSDPHWGPDDGECKGYARRYPLNEEFGALDHASPSRHYQQAHDKDDKDAIKALPCSDRKHGKDVGSDETRANPVEAAYGGKWGSITQTRVGSTLCIRWPAKNHAEDNEDDTKVEINLAKSEGDDPTQQELLKNKIAELEYKNCDEAKNSDRRPCGGCFKVPDIKIGDSSSSSSSK
ncbi:hypothetical protein FBU30_008987 [Linnemannia zychae]|nr:hypothetical protein FBU30_008987 [Linnemannia zychae]